LQAFWEDIVNEPTIVVQLQLEENKTRFVFTFGKRARLCREALKAARSAYFSTPFEENKQNPRFI